MSLVIALAATLLLADEPSKPVAPETRSAHALPTPDDAKHIFLKCGFPDDRVSVAFEKSFDEDVVWIGEAANSLTEQELQCVAQASLNTSYYTFFRNEAEQRRYDLIYWKMSDAASLSSAREWLGRRQLLDAIPLPKRGQPLTRYAKAVEAFCGIERGTLLAVRDEHSMTFTKDGLGRVTPRGFEPSAVNQAQFECVLNVTTAADLKSHDIFFGIIGNEQSTVR